MGIMEILSGIGAFLLSALTMLLKALLVVVVFLYSTGIGHELFNSGAATLIILALGSVVVFWNNIRGLWRNEDWENIEISLNYLDRHGFFRIIELAVPPIKEVFPNYFVRRRFYKSMKRADRKKDGGGLLNYGDSQTAKIIRAAMKSEITKLFRSGYLAEALKLETMTLDCIFAANFERHTGPDAPVAMARLMCVEKELALNTPEADDPNIKVSKKGYRHRLPVIKVIGQRYKSLLAADAEASKKGKDPENAVYMQVRLVEKV